MIKMSLRDAKLRIENIGSTIWEGENKNKWGLKAQRLGIWCDE